MTEGFGPSIWSQISYYMVVSSLLLGALSFSALLIRKGFWIRWLLAGILGALGAVTLYSASAYKLPHGEAMRLYFTQTLPLVSLEWFVIAGLAAIAAEAFGSYCAQKSAL